MMRFACRPLSRAFPAPRPHSVAFFSSQKIKPLRVRKGPKKGDINIPENISPRDLARKLGITLSKLSTECSKRFKWWPVRSLKVMKKNGFLELNHIIFNFAEAQEVAEHWGRTVVPRALHLTDASPAGAPDIQPRQGVVTILGHTDHGKTTLMDSIRGASVADREEAGITQDLYTYSVPIAASSSSSSNSNNNNDNNNNNISDDKVDAADVSTSDSAASSPAYAPRDVTFFDTPGHEAFHDMRQQSTFFSDVCVLVVAADEGVQDQTLESIDFVLGTKTPIVVVLNKVDIATEQQLAMTCMQLTRCGLNLTPHDAKLKSAKSLRKKHLTLKVSALTGENVDVLQDTILRCLDLTKPTADINAVARGAVLEGYHIPGKGSVARVLLREGQLKVEDHYVTGIVHGRVKEMQNMSGELTTLGLPGVPLDILGVKSVPGSGEDFMIMSDKQAAMELAHFRILENDYEKQPRLMFPELQPGFEPKFIPSGGKAAPEESAYLPSALEPEERERYLAASSLEPDEQLLDAPQNRLPAGYRIHAGEEYSLDTPVHGQHEKGQKMSKTREYELAKAGMTDLEVKDEQAGAIVEAEPEKLPLLTIVLKTNNSGSLRMVMDAIGKINAYYGHEAVNVAYQDAGGMVSRWDIRQVQHAKADVHPDSAAKREGVLFYSFRTTKPNKSLQYEAKKFGVREMRHFRVFYDMLDDINAEVTRIAAEEEVRYAESKKAAAAQEEDRKREEQEQWEEEMRQDEQRRQDASPEQMEVSTY